MERGIWIKAEYKLCILSDVWVIQFFFPQLLPEPPGLEAAANSSWTDALLHLRHLGKQADGHGQREAEGHQTHEAVDGQHQSAVTLQESQPTQAKIPIKGKCEPSVWIDPRWLLRVIFGSEEKNIMFELWGAIFQIYWVEEYVWMGLMSQTVNIVYLFHWMKEMLLFDLWKTIKL